MAVNDLINLGAIEALEQAELLASRPVRQIPSWSDPYELSDNAFIKLYRLTKPMTENLIDILTPHIPAPTTISGLSVARKVLLALRFFASGSYQNDIGKNLNHAVSQSVVSKVITEVSDSLNLTDIMNQYIHMPRSIEECQAMRRRFFETQSFPGVLGCIDCTHVAIYPPQRDDPVYPEVAYVNRKGYHSINVQLICDADQKITNICARYPGGTHDSFIWNNSSVCQYMQNLHNHEQSYYLLGDSGYSVRPWLQTPFPDVIPGTPEERYNIAHRRTRSLIERTNGVLKMRFRCLLKHRVLHYAPHRCSKIINSCAVLHNMCIDNNLPPIQYGDEQGDAEINFDYGMYPIGMQQEDEPRDRVNPELVAGRQLRQSVAHNHFNL
nr:unnamed protein product [Callosobruchus analis]CAI5831382.1 unnamed protein product [Callosobruchus analis]